MWTKPPFFAFHVNFPGWNCPAASFGLPQKPVGWDPLGPCRLPTLGLLNCQGSGVIFGYSAAGTYSPPSSWENSVDQQPKDGNGRNIEQRGNLVGRVHVMSRCYCHLQGSHTALRKFHWHILAWHSILWVTFIPSFPKKNGSGKSPPKQWPSSTQRILINFDKKNL